jgi:predicted metal-dependent phosphoesterase TrpH
MIFDFHIHSIYSYDSLLTPKIIIKTAKKKGLEAIAVTDHNRIKGSLETLKRGKHTGLKIITGCEIETDIGDIAGIFIKEKPKSRNGIEVIEEIRDLGGISILVHPFRSHNLNDEVLQMVDVIEVLNCRLENELNKKAIILAKRWNKPMVGGSDSHLRFEIGNMKMETNNDIFDSIINNKIRIIHFRKTNKYCIHLSQLIKSYKMKNIKLAVNSALGLIFNPL